MRAAETGLMSSSGNIVASQLSAEQKMTPALQEQSDMDIPYEFEHFPLFCFSHTFAFFTLIYKV